MLFSGLAVVFVSTSVVVHDSTWRWWHDVTAGLSLTALTPVVRTDHLEWE